MGDKIKDYSNKDCCLNCKGFCKWDGDYCCCKNMKIHQFDASYMNEDIDNTMRTPKTCPDYDRITHRPELNRHITEYRKFKEWDRLCHQLNAHVSDSSGIYNSLKIFKGILSYGTKVYNFIAI